MFGLIVLFGLAVWLGFTVLLTVSAYRNGKTPARKLTFGFLVFMLTMGGWIMYWAVEYMSIQAKVSQLCQTEKGITVYVSPEEYKNRLAKNDLENLPRFKLTSNNIISFENFQYSKFGNENSRISIFEKSSEYGDIRINRSIFVDNQNQIVLLKQVNISVIQDSIDNNLSGLKFWNNSIKDCKSSKSDNLYISQLFINYQGATK